MYIYVRSYTHVYTFIHIYLYTYESMNFKAYANRSYLCDYARHNVLNVSNSKCESMQPKATNVTLLFTQIIPTVNPKRNIEPAWQESNFWKALFYFHNVQLVHTSTM